MDSGVEQYGAAQIYKAVRPDPDRSGVDGFLREGLGSYRQLLKIGKGSANCERWGGSLILVADGRGNAEMSDAMLYHSSNSLRIVSSN